MREMTYQEGKIEGTSFTYHRQGGQVQYKETFKNNKRDGISEEFSPRGNLILSTEYKNGQKVRVVTDNRN
jgi:antitoxin component YwqK of YwqJK toxin-antitoxin module